MHMAYRGQSVHVPCAFSIIEIVSVLYSKILRYNLNDPLDPQRDYLVLSKGHGVMALYACFRELNWLKQEDLDRYFSDGSMLRGLAESNVPGIEATAGSLGHGLPVAAGIAFGLKLKNRSQRVFCIVGDGELNEGSMWESIMFAGHHRLDNLMVIVDANGFQAMGETKSILQMEPFVDKFKAFGFEAASCNGHDVVGIEKACDLLFNGSRLPKALIAQTVKGRGLSFMESENKWHYTRISGEVFASASKELG